MRPFTCDERVHLLLRRLLQILACATTHDADAAANRRPTRDHPRFRSRDTLQPPGQLCARDVCRSLKANALAVAFEERAQLLQAECGTKLRVVAQPGMGIQGKMGAMSMTFTGTVEVVEQDSAAHRVVLSVKSREAGGQGHAND